MDRAACGARGHVPYKEPASKNDGAFDCRGHQGKGTSDNEKAMNAEEKEERLGELPAPAFFF